MGNSEQSYINKRKRQAALESLRYYICRVFPVRKKRIAVSTFEGRRVYCCNPRYIVEELHKRDSGYEFVWIADDMEQECPEYIRKVPNTKWARAYWLSTSKIWIDNYRKPFGTKKRKKQYYINTWHATLGIKPIGRHRGKLFPEIARIVSEADSAQIDYVLTGSGWCEGNWRDGLLYDGEILRTGTARCDVLFNKREEARIAVRKELNLPKDAKLIMYAPTFRGGSQTGQRSVQAIDAQIDFDRLIKAFGERFGGEWYVLLRLHPQLAAKKEHFNTKNNERLIDVTQHPEINELLAAADCYITDYSCTVFEACLMKIPCFIYADDMKEYVQERGELSWDMKKELPFPLATDNDELVECVQKFDENTYLEELSQFIKHTEIMEDGHACERIADLVEQLTEQGKPLEKY